MRRVLLATAAVLAAIVVQVTVLNNVPFPGGSPPDLVLVAVVAMALAGGPLEGALIGFAAGLAVDVAPPASNLVGLSALAFCLAGFGCGQLRGTLENSAWLPVTWVAVGAAAGEVLYALVGLTFGDPDITLAAARQVVPVAAGYDILLSPFVLYAVARLGGYAQWGAGVVPGLLTGRGPRPVRAGLLGAGLLGGGLAGSAGAVRDTGTGRSPRLRAAAARRADAWIGGGSGRPGAAGAWVDRPRPLRLRLRGGVAGSAAAGQPARPGPRLPTVSLRLAAPRRRDGGIASRRGPAGVLPGAAFSDGRSQARLRGAALSGGPSALTRPGQARPRTPRLRLGRRRRTGAVIGGGRLGGGGRTGAPRSARVGRGAFGGASAPGIARNSASAFLARRRPGAPGALRPARGYGATPKFRRPGTRLRRSTGRPRGAAPKFRRSRFRLGRPTGGLGGATPRFRRPYSRLRGAGRGLTGWRPAGRRRGGIR